MKIQINVQFVIKVALIVHLAIKIVALAVYQDLTNKEAPVL